MKRNNFHNKKKILFVCLGNICRSPAAEGIMKHLVQLNGLQHAVEVDSAGIGGWHVGQLPDNRMRRHGKRHGYDFNSRARQFSVRDFDRYDIIVAMDRENIRDLTSMARNRGDVDKIVPIAKFLKNHPNYTTVPDPYYGGDSDFETVIMLLEDACQGLLDSLAFF